MKDIINSRFIFWNLIVLAKRGISNSRNEKFICQEDRSILAAFAGLAFTYQSVG